MIRNIGGRVTKSVVDELVLLREADPGRRRRLRPRLDIRRPAAHRLRDPPDAGRAAQDWRTSSASIKGPWTRRVWQTLLPPCGSMYRPPRCRRPTRSNALHRNGLRRKHWARRGGREPRVIDTALRTQHGLIPQFATAAQWACRRQPTADQTQPPPDQLRLPGEVWLMTMRTSAASVAIPAETMPPARADCHDGIRARVRLPRLPWLRPIRVATLPELLGRIWITCP